MLIISQQRFSLLTAMLSLVLVAIVALPASAEDQYAERQKRTEWFMNARFGMFIHFGAYSIPARGEWVKSVEKMSNEQYQKFVDEFDPVDFDAKALAKLAKEAGMKYAVMTSRHHDGFCMFDSKVSDYKYKKRDLVREFFDAFRNEGLKVGLYYSIIDWHHQDYPHYGDPRHPMRDNPEFRGAEHNWDRYLDFMHAQVEELVSNYGRIDILWLDFSYGEMSGEKWKARELVNMVRKHQPGIILNNRLGGDGVTSLGGDSAFGDFETPEQGIPDSGKVDEQGRAVPWEACLTLNNNWGFSKDDEQWKSPRLIIHTLVNCVSKNGNLLLNVGPDGNGNIPEESVCILKEVGKWMKQNSASIYNCGAADLPKPDWGRFTQNGKYLYAHLMHPKIGHINLKGFDGKVEKVTVLSDGSEAVTATQWWGDASKDNFFINIKAPTYRTYIMPDDIDTVFEITLK